jgi:hypothetical protein
VFSDWSYWNYRVIRKEYSGEFYGAVHRVFYNGEDRITNWTEDACSPFGEDADELNTDIDMMKAALKKPVLEIRGKGKRQILVPILDKKEKKGGQRTLQRASVHRKHAR